MTFEYDAYDTDGTLIGTGVILAEDDYDAQQKIQAIHGKGASVVLRESK